METATKPTIKSKNRWGHVRSKVAEMTRRKAPQGEDAEAAQRRLLKLK